MKGIHEKITLILVPLKRLWSITEAERKFLPERRSFLSRWKSQDRLNKQLFLMVKHLIRYRIGGDWMFSKLWLVMVSRWKNWAYILIILKTPTYLEGNLRKNQWKLPALNKNQYQFSQTWSKENHHFLQGQTDSPFYRALYQVRDHRQITLSPA